MRKIIVLTFVSLDGVMQAPGGPEEDTSGGFKYGGWTASYGDEVFNEVLIKEMQPADLLLGRKTFQIFESYWPTRENIWPGINDVTKYVMTNTIKESDWKNTKFLNSIEEIKKLKNSEGSELQVWGSGNFVQTLLENDLVDELSLKIFPVTLGNGKKIFEGGTIPAAFELVEGRISTTGVIFAKYKRSGEIVTGNVGE